MTCNINVYAHSINIFIEIVLIQIVRLNAKNLTLGMNFYLLKS